MSVVEFTLPSVKALRYCVKYLCFQGDALKVVVSTTPDAPEVRLTRSSIPQYSYSEIVVENPEGVVLSKTLVDDTSEESNFSWVVDSQVFLKTLRLFEGWESLTIELASDLTSLSLHTARSERWARIGVLHDLGPLLNVEHGVVTLHRVLDIRAFCHIVRFVAASQEATCAIVLRFDNLQSMIELKTASSTVFTHIDGGCLEKQVEGSAQTSELAAFGELASEVGKEAKLYVGFGMNDLAMLQLEWEPAQTKKIYLGYMTIESSLAPSHALLIHHSETLQPAELLNIVEVYGHVDEIHTYHLNDNEGLLSIVQHRKPECREACYLSLKLLVSQSEGLLKDIAWIHEDALSLFGQKPYVGPLWCVENTVKKEDPDGYLVIYLKSISEKQRSELLHQIQGRQDVIDFFLDELKGGRCFLHFSSLDAAENVRRCYVDVFSDLKREIHYCTKEDFFLAKN